MQGLTTIAYSLQKDINVYRKNTWMSSPWVTFNLACGKGVTELQNLTNLRLSSFAESHQMQQKNFDVSPTSTSDSMSKLLLLLLLLRTIQASRYTCYNHPHSLHHYTHILYNTSCSLHQYDEVGNQQYYF